MYMDGSILDLTLEQRDPGVHLAFFYKSFLDFLLRTELQSTELAIRLFDTDCAHDVKPRMLSLSFFLVSLACQVLHRALPG